MSSRDGSAKCDAYYTGDPGNEIFDVLFEIDAKHKLALDRAEGLRFGYPEKDAVVIAHDGSGVTAFTYVAIGIDPSLKPYSWYLNHVRVGANEASLPADYVERKIPTIGTIEDSDIERDAPSTRSSQTRVEQRGNIMNLGAFSVSLAVKDIVASQTFYEKLGFETLAGDREQGWIVLKNGDHVVGLFQGMFERNMLTFNPGWNQAAQNVDEFTDVRALRSELIRRDIAIVSDDATQDAGPGSILIEDPDGNPILIDQHR